MKTPMHVFFSGIGGTAIGPLALMARQVGYTVSGSDKQQSAYTDSLQKDGINLYIGQDQGNITKLHNRQPIDWLVYSSAVALEDVKHPELEFAKAQGIKISKRDEFLNKIIAGNQLKMVAVAGTHGKTTTTAMIIWLFKQLELPISYLVGGKISFGPMGQFTQNSPYLVYECDEFDRNFLAFHPYLSVITGIAWDHHEFFKTQQDYIDAFADFADQSQNILAWDEESGLLRDSNQSKITALTKTNPMVAQITLPGEFNRQDAWQAVTAVQKVTGKDPELLISLVNKFPGLKQRMERLAPNLYSNYAHTPEKILGGMLTAKEIAAPDQKIIVIYEPLTNRRQHHIKNDYKNCFEGAQKIYWVPTYLAREDPNLPILTPEQLIPYLTNSQIAEPAKMNDTLLQHLREHLKNGNMVVAMDASGARSLDEWLRNNLDEITKT